MSSALLLSFVLGTIWSPTASTRVVCTNWRRKTSRLASRFYRKALRKKSCELVWSCRLSAVKLHWSRNERRRRRVATWFHGRSAVQFTRPQTSIRALATFPSSRILSVPRDTLKWLRRCFCPMFIFYLFTFGLNVIHFLSCTRNNTPA